VELGGRRERTRGTARGGRGRAAAALLVCAAMVAACGSRLPTRVLSQIDAQRTGAAATAGSSSGGGATGQSASSASGTGGTAVGSSGGTSAVATGSSTSGGLGTATGGGAAVGVVADCHGGATAPGVTATNIKVGAIVTASGPLPGATEGSFRGAQAYLAKVNAAGGVCGRQITLEEGDDGLDPQRGRSEFLRLEPQVLAMVGGFAVADSGFGDLVRSTGIPYVGTLVDPAGRGPSVYPRVPVNETDTSPYLYFKNTYPAVKNVGFLWADVAGVRANTPIGREGLKRVGYQVVYDSGLSAVSPDYTSDVIAMRNAGAQMVYLFAFEVNMQVRLARNMRQQNFEPPLKVAQIGYTSDVISLLGDVANGWIGHLDYLPFLNADEPARSPAVADFLTWNQRVAAGSQLDLFAVDGWGAAALFVQALQKVGPNVTRASLLQALDGITSSDGGGMRAPSNPKTGATQNCFIIVRVQNGRWVREHPATGFDCGHGESYHYG
jgi:branched-chain amino acid transport system substrate-binding protein